MAGATFASTDMTVGAPRVVLGAGANTLSNALLACEVGYAYSGRPRALEEQADRRTAPRFGLCHIHKEGGIVRVKTRASPPHRKGCSPSEQVEADAQRYGGSWVVTMACTVASLLSSSKRSSELISFLVSRAARLGVRHTRAAWSCSGKVQRRTAPDHSTKRL